MPIYWLLARIAKERGRYEFSERMKMRIERCHQKIMFFDGDADWPRPIGEKRIEYHFRDLSEGIGVVAISSIGWYGGCYDTAGYLLAELEEQIPFRVEFIELEFLSPYTRDTMAYVALVRAKISYELSDDIARGVLVASGFNDIWEGYGKSTQRFLFRSNLYRAV